MGEREGDAARTLLLERLAALPLDTDEREAVAPPLMGKSSSDMSRGW